MFEITARKLYLDVDFDFLASDYILSSIPWKNVAPRTIKYFA